LTFAFTIGFATTVAEPALIAIADKAALISHGPIDAFWLRMAVASSVGFSIALGTLRILLGHPIAYYIINVSILVVLITFFALEEIIGLAYDSGGVTTSTVTVPLVAALRLGLAGNIEGRNPLIDGFGLIAFASLFPMITVMGYGIYATIKSKERIHEICSTGSSDSERKRRGGYQDSQRGRGGISHDPARQDDRARREEGLFWAHPGRKCLCTALYPATQTLNESHESTAQQL